MTFTVFWFFGAKVGHVLSWTAPPPLFKFVTSIWYYTINAILFSTDKSVNNWDDHFCVLKLTSSNQYPHFQNRFFYECMYLLLISDILWSDIAVWWVLKFLWVLIYESFNFFSKILSYYLWNKFYIAYHPLDAMHLTICTSVK